MKSADEPKQSGETPRNSSEDLARKVMSGDRASEDDFVKGYYNWLLILVRRKFPKINDHEDIVQEAFMIVIARLKVGGIEKPEKILSFLRTTANNIGLEYLRKGKKFDSDTQQEVLENIASNKGDVLSSIIWDDRVKFVKQVISGLRQRRDREILYRFYFQDQSKISICKKLKLSPEHFDRVLYRAKQRLKDLVDDNINKSDGNRLKSFFARRNNKPDNIVLRCALFLSRFLYNRNYNKDSDEVIL